MIQVLSLWLVASVAFAMCPELEIIEGVSKMEVKDFIAESEQQLAKDELVLTELNKHEVGGAIKKWVVETYNYGRDSSGNEYFVMRVHPEKVGYFLGSIRSARILSRLGFGPNVHVYKKGVTYFIAYDFVPGINLKEILYKEARTAKTWDKIREILPESSGTFEGDLRLIAQRILDDPLTVNGMVEVAGRLDLLNVIDTTLDLQFMVSPGKAVKPAVIDGDRLDWSGAAKPSGSRRETMLDNVLSEIEILKKLANAKPSD